MGINLGGLVAGALGGAGAAVESTAQGQLDVQNKASLAQQMSDMEVQKQALIQQNQIAAQNQMREAQVGRVNTQLTGLVGTMANQKFGTGDPDAVAAAANGQTDAPLTADQLATINSVNSAKQSFTDSAMLDPTLRLDAAAQTGDLALHDQSSANARLQWAQAIGGARTYAADQHLAGVQDTNATKLTTSADSNATKLQANTDKIAALQKIATQKAAALGTNDQAVYHTAVSLDKESAGKVQLIKQIMANMPAKVADKIAAQAQIVQLQQQIDANELQKRQLWAKSAAARDAYSAAQAAHVPPADVPDATAPTAPAAPAPGAPAGPASLNGLTPRPDVMNAIQLWNQSGQ